MQITLQDIITISVPSRNLVLYIIVYYIPTESSRRLEREKVAIIIIVVVYYSQFCIKAMFK